MTDKPEHETIEWDRWTGDIEDSGINSADRLISIWLRRSPNGRGGQQWNMTTTLRGRWSDQEIPPMAFPASGSHALTAEAARASATGMVQYALIDQHVDFPPERLAELRAKFAELEAKEDQA
jgi:hypothetical protein